MEDPTKKQNPTLIYNKRLNPKNELTQLHPSNKHTKRVVTLKTEQELNHSNNNNLVVVAATANNNKNVQSKVKDCNSTPTNHIPAKKRLCTICNKRFRGKGGLEAHIRDKHKKKSCFVSNSNVVVPPKRTNPKGKPFKCTCIHCNKPFTTKHELQSHVLSKHSRALVLAPEKNPAVIRTAANRVVQPVQKNCTTPADSKKQHICTICNMKFSTKGRLLEHIKNDIVHNKKLRPKKSHYCSICSKSFHTQEAVTAHTNSKHKDPIISVHSKFKRYNHDKYSKYECVQKNMNLYIPFTNIVLCYPTGPRSLKNMTRRTSTQQKSQHHPHLPKKQPTDCILNHPIIRAFSGSTKRGRKKEIRNDRTLKPFGMKPPWILTYHAKDRLRERGPQSLPRYVKGTNQTVVVTFVPTNFPEKYQFRSRRLRNERKRTNKLINYIAKNGTRTLDKIYNLMRNVTFQYKK